MLNSNSTALLLINLLKGDTMAELCERRENGQFERFVNIDGFIYDVHKLVERLCEPELFFTTVQLNQQINNIQGNLSSIGSQLINLTSYSYQNLTLSNKLLDNFEDARYEKSISKFRECVSDTETSFIFDNTYLPSSSEKLSSLFAKLNCSIDDLLNYFRNENFESTSVIDVSIINDIFYKIQKAIDYMLAIIIQKAIEEHSFTVEKNEDKQEIITIDEKVINKQLERFYQNIEKKLFVIKEKVAVSIFQHYKYCINNILYRFSFIDYYNWINFNKTPSCRTQLDNWDLMGNSQLSFLFEYHISFYLYLEQLENERNNLQYQDQQNIDNFISFLINKYTQKYNFLDLKISTLNDIKNSYTELITRIFVKSPTNNHWGVLLHIEQLNRLLRNNLTFDKAFEKFRKNKGVNLY